MYGKLSLGGVTLGIRAAKSYIFVMRCNQRTGIALCNASATRLVVITRMPHHAGPYEIKFDVTVSGQYILIPLGDA